VQNSNGPDMLCGLHRLAIVSLDRSRLCVRASMESIFTLSESFTILYIYLLFTMYKIVNV